jgi:hypothetical protein
MTLSHFSLPFSFPEVYEGFASAQGIMRVERDHLVLEFEIKEAILDWIKLGSRVVQIPFTDLESVVLKRGWFRDVITVKVRSLQALQEIPIHEHGRFQLFISKQDRTVSQELCDVLQLQILNLDIARLEQESSS